MVWLNLGEAVLGFFSSCPNIVAKRPMWLMIQHWFHLYHGMAYFNLDNINVWIWQKVEASSQSSLPHIVIVAGFVHLIFTSRHWSSVVSSGSMPRCRWTWSSVDRLYYTFASNCVFFFLRSGKVRQTFATYSWTTLKRLLKSPEAKHSFLTRGW